MGFEDRSVALVFFVVKQRKASAARSGLQEISVRKFTERESHLLRLRPPNQSSRSSTDRMPACGVGDEGSIPSESTRNILIHKIQFRNMEQNPQEPREQFNMEFEKFFKEYELHRIRDSIFEKTATLVVAAIGLIAALAWDDALKQLFEDIFGPVATTNRKIIYASVITIIAVLFSIFFNRAIKKRREKSRI